MTNTNVHAGLSGRRIHVPYAFSFTNYAAMIAASRDTSDVGKLAKLDDGTLWILTDDSPLTWQFVGGDAVFCDMSTVSSQTINTSNTTQALFGTTDGQNPAGQHFTSAANLTGTVAKAASAKTLIGTGTAFLTELAVGQVISVPGTAAEKNVITAIADDTHATVQNNWANTATGQTAARVNSAFVAPFVGRYSIVCRMAFTHVTEGKRSIQLYVNAAAVTGAKSGDRYIKTNDDSVEFVWHMKLNQYDFVEFLPLTDETTSPISAKYAQISYLGNA